MATPGHVEQWWRRQSSRCWAALWLCAGVARAEAVEQGYALTLGVIESDNVSRTQSDGGHETIATQEFELTRHDRGRRLDSDVDLDLSHLDYLHHTFKDEVIGNFLGRARVTLAPEVFSWSLADNFGQVRLSPTAPLTPANRENINYLTTGPDLILPVSSQYLVDLLARYGRTQYQVSPLDNNRWIGGAGLIRRLSAASAISFNLRDERVDYLNRIDPGYQRQEGFVRLSDRGSRTLVGADFGYVRLRTPGTTSGNLLTRLELTRLVSAFSTVRLNLGHQYSDGAEAFQLAQSLSALNLDTQSVVQSGRPFMHTYGSLAWNFQRNRTGFGLSASQFADRYPQNQALDDDRTEAWGHLSRRLTPWLQVAAFESYLRERFRSSSQVANESTTGAQLSWRVGQFVSLSFAYTHAARHSNIPLTDYTENRLRLSVSYGRATVQPEGPPIPPLPDMSVYPSW